MRVTLREHGGFLAGIARTPRTVEDAALPPPARAELERLVAAACAEASVASTAPGQMRDAMSYTITIEGVGAATVILRGRDTAMTPGFAALLAWLRQRR